MTLRPKKSFQKRKMDFTENEKPEISEKSHYAIGGFLFELVKVVFWAFLIIAPIRIFLFQPFFVQGASMEPNFSNNEYLIINELGYKKTQIGIPGKPFFSVEPFKNLERNEVIVFRYPKKKSQFFIKRIIGLPGEKVEIKNNQVFIHNQEYPEGFRVDESNYLEKEVQTKGDLVVTLGAEEFFVMGDNRMFSSDSRSWGPVNRGDIIGRVFLRAWPLHKLVLF